MTIQHTLTLIRALGVSANYSSVYHEFRVGGPEPNTYYTDDRYDAIYTALYIRSLSSTGRAGRNEARLTRDGDAE